jgi:hypothetical protein
MSALIVNPDGAPMRLTAVDRDWRDAMPIDPREAIRTFNQVRMALGASTGTVPIFRWRSDKESADGYATVGAANSKLSKQRDLLIGGVTTLPHKSAWHWLRDTDAKQVIPVANALGLFPDELLKVLSRSVCSHKTTGCGNVCLITEAGRDEHRWVNASAADRWSGNIKRAQLARLILTLARPDAALTLELEAMQRTAEVAADIGRGFRWRVNIADDIAREVNPRYRYSLIDSARESGQAVAYSYSKRPDRFSTAAHTVCLSASERTTDEQIAARLAAAGTVAVPLLGIGRDEPMPATYRGFPLVDGDKTDDRTSDPAGHCVGLRVKGSRAATLDHRGFLREWVA